MVKIANLLTTIKQNSFYLQIIILIVLNFLLTKFMYKFLPEESNYTNANIILSLFNNYTLIFILFISISVYIIKVKWSDIIDVTDNYVKYFILFIMSIWAWKVITLDFNLYFNQAFDLDRILLLTLAIMAFRFPVALMYFIIYSIIFFNQVSFPGFAGIFPNQYIDSTPLVDILILFVVYIFLKKAYKDFSILAFIVVMLCLHASNYFIPGLAKVVISENYIDWVYVNDLSNILAAQYFQGWLHDVISFDIIKNLLVIVHNTTIPMQIVAFVTQLIVIFTFINRKFTLMLFFTCELLHIGVFFSFRNIFLEMDTFKLKYFICNK